MIYIQFKVSTTRDYSTNITELTSLLPSSPCATMCAYNGTDTAVVTRATNIKLIGSNYGVSFYHAYKHKSDNTDSLDDSLLIPIKAIGIKF